MKLQSASCQGKLSQFVFTRNCKRKEWQSVNVVRMKAIIWIISNTYIFFNQIPIIFFHFIWFLTFSKSFSDLCILAPYIPPSALLYVQKRRYNISTSKSEEKYWCELLLGCNSWANIVNHVNPFVFPKVEVNFYFLWWIEKK